MRKYLLVVCLMVEYFSVVAQNKVQLPLNNIQSGTAALTLPGCGLDIVLNERRKDPTFKAAEELMNAAILRASRLLDDTIYTLPLVFHVIRQNPNSITDQDIINEVKNLNEIFGKTGAFSSSAGADTKIRFCLARKDPEGGTTSGITRTQSFFGTDLEQLTEDEKLKNMVQWDPSRYVNIWLVSNIVTENLVRFGCGIWTRLGESGYAFMPVPEPKVDGIVVAGIGGSTLLAHEMGHYLGLYHTFEGLNCINNNCETDGDRVCDTPPDASTGNSASCNSPSNSCSTDTLSSHSNGIFSTDVPDQIANIMDYGNDACHNQFSEGQAVRMRAAIVTQRSGLLQNACDQPCPENTMANFTRNNWDPVPGNIIQFTNTSSGASNFVWLVDDVPVSTNANYSQSFGARGKFKITLKAFNSDASCYSTYTDYVIVTCGTHARFYTDKRIIASKSPVYTDSIRFTNNSVNATSFQWLMRFNQEPEQTISTTRDYRHVFLNPGNYTMRLVAMNGNCADTTEFFTIPVADPTQDGTMTMNTGQCYQESKIRVTVQVCNFGYAPIPAKTPISFYDADPRTANAHKIGNTFFFPVAVNGNCCSISYPFLIDSAPGLNQLYGVLNDSGTTIPLKLPNTGMLEIDYNNNISFINNLQVDVTVIPSTATLVPGDTLQLAAQVINGFGSPSYLWSSPDDMNCTSCPSPYYVADNRIDTITKLLVVTNSFGCTDSSYTVIKIPPFDDFSITIDSIKCAGTDSLYGWFTICNKFKRGIIPQGLQMALYNSNPSAAGANLLRPVYVVNQQINGACFSFQHHFKRTAAGDLYAVINNAGVSVPVKFPSGDLLAETSYSNNITSFSYKPETVSVQPADTTVFRKQTVQLTIKSPVYDPSSISWSVSRGYSLDCNNCAAPIATVTDSSILQVQMANQYGCLVKGNSKLNVFPPDFTLQLLETSCYTNSTTRVKFKICMNNSYDTVQAGIPVSFYDGDPTTGAAVLLGPVFYTSGRNLYACDTFIHVITSPATFKLYALINNTGNAIQLIKETDYANNMAETNTVPFIATLSPTDTTVLRFSPVQLTGSVTGGKLSSALWNPVEFLSCRDCPSPVVKPAYSKNYSFITRNEFYCVDTAYTFVKTFSGGIVSIPNAFTPDNNGTNDLFYVMGNEDVKIVKELSIFNRWGQKIFSVNNVPANDPRHGWDGLMNGQPATGGAYVYVANVEFADGRTKLYKGTVVLVR